MHRLVAARRVEDLLRACSQVDRGHVTLIVAVVAWVAPVYHVKIGRPIGGCGREGRRAFFIETFERGQLRPAAAHDFSAVADLILVHVAVETVAVDILPIGIDGRGGRRIARASRPVDLARSGPVLMGPGLASRLGVERNDAAVPGRDEKQVLGTRRGTHSFQEYRRPIRRLRKRDLVLLRQCADVVGGDRCFSGISPAVLGIPTELQPVVGMRRRDRQRNRQCAEAPQEERIVMVSINVVLSTA